MAPDGPFGLRGSHTDVWGFATTVLHLATGRLPYQGPTHWQIMFAMSNRRLPEVPFSLPEWLQEALTSCLNFDPAARTSVSQLRQVRCAQVKLLPNFFPFTIPISKHKPGRFVNLGSFVDQVHLMQKYTGQRQGVRYVVVGWTAPFTSSVAC